MRICPICNYAEKDNSSLFCSNCGKSFNKVTTLTSNQKVRVPTEDNSKKRKILGYFLTVSLLSSILVDIFTGLSILLIFSLILTTLILFAFIKLRFSYNFVENKKNTEFNGEMPKIRPPSFGFRP